MAWLHQMHVVPGRVGLYAATRGCEARPTSSLPSFLTWFLGARAHLPLCGWQEACVRVPGSLWVHGKEEASPLRKELVSEAKLPSGPKTHVLQKGNATPPPQSLRSGGRAPSPTLVQGEPHCGAARRSVLLLFLLLGRGCQRFVLDPEAFREEGDDGAVQVQPEAFAVEVMAFIRVDLQRSQEVTGCPPFLAGCGCRRDAAPHSWAPQVRLSLQVNFLVGPTRLSASSPRDPARRRGTGVNRVGRTFVQRTLHGLEPAA